MIYADHAATSPMRPAALRAYLQGVRELWANPSSLYGPGQRAKAAMEEARGQIARCLGANPREILFTSGGSEADNQALRTGAVLGAKAGKCHIVSTKIEHPAVLRTLEALREEGFRVTLLDVDGLGRVDPHGVEAAIQEDTALVSVMLANNEVGTLEPVREIAALCRKRGILCHTDAVQAVGQIPVNVEELGVDLMSLSGHKFGGPKGIGALYCRRGIQAAPLIRGGGQERGKRAGTEDVPGILAMAAALGEAAARMEESRAGLVTLRDRLTAGLLEIPGARRNGDPANRLPGNVHVSFRGVEGEALLVLLDQAGICASAGSACSSGSLEPSHVLRAMGVPEEYSRGSLRLTLGPENTMEEVECLIHTVEKAVIRLQK